VKKRTANLEKQNTLKSQCSGEHTTVQTKQKLSLCLDSQPAAYLGQIAAVM